MKHKRIGRVTDKVKRLLNIENPVSDIKVYDDGLYKHLIKRKHGDVLAYYDKISEILADPDYVGVNPNEKGESIEYIKVYDDNVLVAVKLHPEADFYYVPTMYTVQDFKVNRRLHSGRLKKVDK